MRDVQGLIGRSLLLSAAVALVVSACSAGGESGEPAASSPDEVTSPGGAETSSDGDAESGEGGTLAIGMTLSQLPGSLDTGFIESTATEGERFITLQIYDGLTRWDMSQADGPSELVGNLAESWEVGDDGLTWTFHLREGVTFHDGTPWDADAAIYNLERYLNADHPFFSEDIDALMGYWLIGAASFSKIDDMTIEIVTDGPYAFLGEDLVLVPFASPTALEEMGPEEFGRNPVGTGPFRFVSVSDSELVLERNTDYWDGAPKLDRLILKPIGDVVARTAALRSGEVNWIERPNPDDVPQLEGEGFELYAEVYSHIWPWMFDVEKAPVDDKRVRQALNLAIDREAITTGLLHDTAIPAYQYAPPSDPGHVPELDAQNQRDIDAAKELLAEAGYPDGFELRVSYPTGGASQMILPGPMNEALQAQLAEIGVDVTLEPSEWTIFLDDYYRAQVPGGAHVINVTVNYIPASSWSYYFKSDSEGNVNHLYSDEIDEFLAEAAATFDPDERTAVFEELNRYLMDEAPYLIVASDAMPRVLADEVQGFVQPLVPWADLTEVWIDE